MAKRSMLSFLRQMLEWMDKDEGPPYTTDHVQLRGPLSFP